MSKARLTKKAEEVLTAINELIEVYSGGRVIKKGCPLCKVTNCKCIQCPWRVIGWGEVTNELGIAICYRTTFHRIEEKHGGSAIFSEVQEASVNTSAMSPLLRELRADCLRRLKCWKRLIEAGKYYND
jgi:hypothetical protein